HAERSEASLDHNPLPAAQRPIDLLRRDGQIFDSHAHRVFDRIGDGGSRGTARILPDSFDLVRPDAFVAGNNYRLERRDIFNRGDLVLAEVSDFDVSLPHRQILDQSVTDPLYDPAVDLTLMTHGVHDHAGVMRRRQSPQCNLAGLRINSNL